MAAAAKLKIGEAELEQLVELLDADVQRLSVEIEKLSLFAGENRAVTSEDLERLSPSARASTIFKLVNAIGANRREEALDIINLLVQEGEYLPLALSFAGTQFRLALAAKEAKLSSAMQIQGHFSKQGIPMWRSRAEQVAQTATVFSAKQLMGALKKVHAADRALRSASPDDRIVLEQFVMSL
jgi:DNA polymerase-3 subunit delta